MWNLYLQLCSHHGFLLQEPLPVYVKPLVHVPHCDLYLLYLFKRLLQYKKSIMDKIPSGHLSFTILPLFLIIPPKCSERIFFFHLYWELIQILSWSRSSSANDSSEADFLWWWCRILLTLLLGKLCIIAEVSASTN